ncbi:MAG: 8-amino-7-oxononanoate synthase, partial [Nitrospirae bacterium CG_4_9_14_3_um_filter_51_5]
MFKEDLQTLAQQHLLRELSLIDSPSAPVISVEGREVLLFASNNYLGLANHPQVKDAAMKAIEKFGVGSGASRLISGNVTPHHTLEG